MTATHDLFLSYRRADGPAVAPLLAALQSRGVRVWQDKHEVDDFASIQRSVETGLAGARALLAWYSLRYNDSRACQWELTAAYCAAQAEGDPRQRILVLNPEPGNAHVHLPELFDQLHLSAQGLAGDDAAVQALADRIQATLRTTVPATPLGAVQAMKPPRWLPAMGTGSPRFVGRLAQLRQLHGQLQAVQAVVITGTGGKPGMALVRGAGGIGKSLLAEEYALRFGAAYPGGVFWLRAHGHPDGGTAITPAQRTHLRDAQVLDLAQGLGLDTHGLTATQVRAALAGHFQHAGQRFLWVIDDLPSDLDPKTLNDWLPPHPLGCSLFTSRTRRFTQLPCLDLPQLEPADARGLLTRHRQLTTAEAATADAICADLGYHALAVDVTAALVERRGLDGTQRALARTDQDVLDLAAQFDEALPNGHQRHIAATFLASIDQLDEHARDLLRLASVLAAAPMPRPLLVRCVAAASGLDDDGAQDRTDLATDRLLSSSLADDAGDGAISVHTLVARTVRFAEASAGSLAAWRVHAVGVLTEEMVQADDIRRHAQLEPWVVHARELSDSADDLASAKLLGWVARYDLERGAYALARSGFERELEVRQRVQGETHSDSLTSMNNLAYTMQFQGDYSGARRLYEKVLEPNLDRLYEDQFVILASFSGLSAALRKQGDLPGARRLQEFLLDLHQRVLGKEHPATLGVMASLSTTLRWQGELAGSRRLQELVLEVRERVLGKEHPDTLSSKSNLSATLHNQGDLPRAGQLLESVLEVQKRVLGKEHPDTLTSMNGLAQTLLNLGDLPGASRLFGPVLEVRRRVLGTEHPDTLASMNNLAVVMQRQGDLSGAGRLLETVLDLLKGKLGELHPETLRSMNNLAATLWAQGEHDRARRLQTQCVAGFMRTLGPTHAHTRNAEQGLMLLGGPLDPDATPNPP